MRKVRHVVPAMTAALIAVVGASSPAIAEEAEATHVDEFTATVSADAITVNGKATFVDTPVEVAADDAGDSTLSGAPGTPFPAADDLTAATVARPDPFADTLTFTLDITNQPPATSGIPELLTYRWPISVRTGDDSSRAYEMVALRSAQWSGPASTDPYFMLFTCPAGPAPQCEAETALEGRMADGVVEWTVPADAIGAVTGSVIAPAGSIQVVASASSLAWGVHTFDEAEATTDYTVPAPVVRFGIAPEGTPPEQVPLTTEGALETDGTFAGALPLPDSTGVHTVVVEACHAPDSCGIATTVVTL